MMKQTFVLNDKTSPELLVVKQKSKKYDAMTIQISEVVDLESEFATVQNGTATFPLRYIYEEVDENDFIFYARYMDKANVDKFYIWFDEKEMK